MHCANVKSSAATDVKFSAMLAARGTGVKAT